MEDYAWHKLIIDFSRDLLYRLKTIMRVFLIVLDSVGIGEAPDAEEYGDTGCNTLSHISLFAGGLNLPALEQLGLGNIPALLPKGIPIKGVPPRNNPEASFGALQEMSKGKDTTTGHWEMAGLLLEKGFKTFPRKHPSFPSELITDFERLTGRKVIGNLAESGTEIIARLGERQMKEGCWIVYTSADSVFQIAAHEEIIPLEELYKACETARGLCDRYFVGRVIARPYIGTPGNFTRTENRRDFSMPPPEPTILDKLHDNGINVITVGKIDDVFHGRGINESFHVENNHDAQKKLLELVSSKSTGLIFVNLIDFDMLYGHRRDPDGYAAALRNTDSCIGKLIPMFNNDDLMIITADHGNDPTFKGTDHTREFAPLLVFQKNIPGTSLGIRKGFYDISRSIAELFELKDPGRGISFLNNPIRPDVS